MSIITSSKGEGDPPRTVPPLSAVAKLDPRHAVGIGYLSNMDAPNLYSAHDSKRDSPAILFRRLGFGFPLELVQPGAFQTYWDRSECLILQREKEMLTFMDRITDLENWRDKVFDEEALSIWRGEQVEGTGFWSRECFNQVSIQASNCQCDSTEVHVSQSTSFATRLVNL